MRNTGVAAPEAGGARHGHRELRTGTKLGAEWQAASPGVPGFSARRAPSAVQALGIALRAAGVAGPGGREAVLGEGTASLNRHTSVSPPQNLRM